MNKLTLGWGLVAMVSAAGAQEVSVFGVIDAGISHYRVSGGQRLTALSDSAETSSRLGFRGREDLGNGLSAQFWLEGGFEASSPGAFDFARRSTIGLAGRFGEVRLGRDYTPSFNMLGAFGTPFGTNGVGEDLLYRARATSHGSANGGQSTNVRASNAINYFLPKDLGGVYGQFMLGLDEASEGKAGRYVGARLGYKTGAWDMGLAYNTAEGGLGAPASRPRDMKNLTLGASYDFGVAAVSLMQIADTVAMPLGDKKLSGTSLGLTVPLGTGELRAGYSRVSFDHPTDQARARKLALGYTHPLSKRTALYTTVSRVQNKDQASFVAGGGLTGIANRSSSGIDIGLRHRF